MLRWAGCSAGVDAAAASTMVARHHGQESVVREESLLVRGREGGLGMGAQVLDHSWLASLNIFRVRYNFDGTR